MSMQNDRKRRRLLNLWHKDQKCHWCKCPVILVFRPNGIRTSYFSPHLPFLENEATIDHLESKHSDIRKNGYKEYEGQEVTVLACYKCNRERNNKELESIPVQELHKRSKRDGKPIFAPEPEISPDKQKRKQVHRLIQRLDDDRMERAAEILSGLLNELS